MTETVWICAKGHENPHYRPACAFCWEPAGPLVEIAAESLGVAREGSGSGKVREYVYCKTQKQCDAALKAKKIPRLVGDGDFSVGGTAYVVALESSHVVARGSSHVVAWGSSHVEALGSSHVEAWGSSHVVALESSHVEARGSSHVVAWGSSHVEASSLVAVHQHSTDSKVSGGVVIVVKAPKTPAEWCEYYGARIEDGHAILFKGVDENFKSPHGICYAPGTMPTAPDWDGGKHECGGGLHFSPSPLATLEFNASAKRFIACPIKLEEIAVHPKPSYPNKVKAPRVAKPCYEVDRYGNAITPKEVSA